MATINDAIIVVSSGSGVTDGCDHLYPSREALARDLADSGYDMPDGRHLLTVEDALGREWADLRALVRFALALHDEARDWASDGKITWQDAMAIDAAIIDAIARG